MIVLTVLSGNYEESRKTDFVLCIKGIDGRPWRKHMVLDVRYGIEDFGTSRNHEVLKCVVKRNDDAL